MTRENREKAILRLGELLLSIFCVGVDSPSTKAKNIIQKISSQTLHLCFQIFWELQGWSTDGKYFLLLENKNKRYFSIDVKSNLLMDFQEISEENVDHNSMLIHLLIPSLSEAAKKSLTHLTLALLKGEALQVSTQNFIWDKLLYKARFSPESIDLIRRWLFKYSGIGIIFWTGKKALPWIFYGGDPCKLKLMEMVEEKNRTSFTQSFRFRHKLGLAISIETQHLHNCLQKGWAATSCVYGKEWSISLPLEINDLLLNFRNLKSFLPQNSVFDRCNICKESFDQLFGLYLENAWKYLKRSSIYLKLKDSQNSLLFEITHEGIYEIVEREDIPAENLFVVDIEIIAALMAWFNDTSLKLFAKFIDGILPAEISHKIQREEVLVDLDIEDTEGEKYRMILCGSEQSLPGKWTGDFSLYLLDPGKRILFQEAFMEKSLGIVKEGKGYRLYFPSSSELAGKSLYFSPVNQAHSDYGFCRLISHTSVFSELSPGIRHTLVTGKAQQRWPFQLKQNYYQIIAGNLLWRKSQGRILKQHFARTTSHTWLTRDCSGVMTSAESSLASKKVWWRNFLQTLQNGTLVLTPENSYECTEEQSFFPYKNDEGQIELKTKYIGWKLEEKIYVRLWFLQAWAVPFDKRGNFLIRIRSLAKINKQEGIALVEIPIRMPSLLEKTKPISLEVKPHKQGLRFYAGNFEVLSLNARRYLKLLRPAPRWPWK